jgi:hypothetical protein
MSSTYPSGPAPRRRWMGITIGVVIVAAIALVAYFALYSGGGSSGANGGGGGYFVVALGADAIRRAMTALRARR